LPSLAHRVPRHLALVFIAASLSGCWDSDSTPSSINVSFQQEAISVTAGSHREVVLSLARGTGVSGHRVMLTTSDATVAEIMPSSCTLSDSSPNSSMCRVKVYGKTKGIAVLLAQAPGQSSVPLKATVGEATVYGNLAVSNSSGTFVTSSPVSLPISATAPYQVTLSATIEGSSGITSATGAYINFSTSTSGVTYTQQQCAVTTAAPTCTATATLPSSAPVTFTAAVVGSVTVNNPGYSSITINAGGGTPGTNGTIALSTQSGNNVPIGMKAPLFVNWTGPTQTDVVTVNLSIAGSGATFYSYAAGNNQTMNTATSATCTLTNAATVATSQLNCGLGLVGSGSAGTVTVSGTATGAAGTYTIAPLTLAVVAPDAARRTVTFTNASVTQTIYVGITGGAASSYLNATTPAIPPGTTTANMKPGAGSTCGPSNPQAACPTGTTCIQGGSAPNSNIGDTPFYCYYDQPTPVSTTSPATPYTLAPGAATTLNISGSSLSPNDIFWSGNFYPRTGCDATTGVCENATCVGAAGGLACGPGTGPTPGTNTLAELTFQMYPATDFYDVSIINGANFAAAFGPTSLSVSSTNAYFCGTAGNGTAVNGGYSAGSIAGLPAAPWTMAPTSASFPPGLAPTTQSAASFFRVVIPSTSSPTACTSSASCTAGSDTACGWSMSSVMQGSAFTYASGLQVCGKPVAWMTADTIWGQNSSSTNAAPFNFAQTFDNGSGGTVAVSDLQLCVNGTYSAYINNGTSSTFPIQPVALACGGVMWGPTVTTLQTPAPTNTGLGITQTTQPVQTVNANWVTNVLPTIQWLKQACPTCYTYPFDDMSSTFTCSDAQGQAGGSPTTAYGVTFSDLN